MSGDIGKGDWVECVHEGPSLTLHKLYLVEEIVSTPNGSSTCHGKFDQGLILKDMRLEPMSLGWCPGCFRPVYRQKDSLLAEMKAPPVSVSPPVHTKEPA